MTWSDFGVVTPPGQNISLTQSTSTAWWLVLIYSWVNLSNEKLRALPKDIPYRDLNSRSIGSSVNTLTNNMSIVQWHIYYQIFRWPNVGLPPLSLFHNNLTTWEVSINVSIAFFSSLSWCLLLGLFVLNLHISVNKRSYDCLLAMIFALVQNFVGHV